MKKPIVKKMLKKALLAATIVACLGLTGCSAKEEGTEAAATEETATETAVTEEEGTEETYTLRIAMECAYAPFNWTQTDDSNGAVQIAGSPDYVNGYDILIAKKICEANGWNLEVYKAEWDSIILGLQSNKYDTIMSGMLITEERKQAVNFSVPYYTAKDCLLVKKDSPYAAITTLAEAAGSSMVTQCDTMWDSDYIDQVENVNHLTPLVTVPEIVVAVTSGKADFGLLDTPSCMSACSTNPELTYIEFEDGKGFTLPEGQSNDMGIAVRKEDTEVLEKINAAMADLDDAAKSELMQQAIDMQPANME